MKYIAKAIRWYMKHEFEVWLAALPFLLIAFFHALFYALECAMW